ncbi:hypothetical protein [Methylobacterium nigriterrae]
MIPASIPTASMSRRDESDPCGGTRILDLAICLILAVTIVGLLMLAL